MSVFGPMVRSQNIFHLLGQPLAIPKVLKVKKFHSFQANGSSARGGEEAKQPVSGTKPERLAEADFERMKSVAEGNAEQCQIDLKVG